MSSNEFDQGATAMRRRTFLLAAGATVLLPMPSGVLFAQEAAKKGGQVNFVAWPPPTYLTSAIATSAEVSVGTKFFDGLLEYEFDMTPKPSLAEKWEASEDGLRITFNLRKGVKWHDGQALTSKDVAFTIMQITKIHHGRGRVTFAAVTDVETPDEYTAVFILSQPAPAVLKSLNSMETPIMPAHLYEGTEIMQNPYNINPVGTGPWKLVEYKIGESVVMERNPDYWREGLPNIDVLTIQYVGDAATRTALLETGAVDVATHSMVPLSDVQRLRDSGSFDVTEAGYATYSSLQFIDFRLDHEILGKKEVRHALAHAIDLQWIVENILYGYSRAATGPIHQDNIEYYTTEGVPSYPFDLAKAEQLLDAAGYPRGADGVRFELTMVPTPWGETTLPTAEYIREQFRQIGVSMNIVTGDMGSFVKRVYGDRNFDLNITSGNSGADPAIGVHRFYKSSAFQPGVAFSNASGFKNEEVDALLEAAETEMDASKRKEQYKRFQQIVMEELPSFPLVATSYLTVANKRVHDHTIGAVGAFGSMAEAWIES